MLTSIRIQNFRSIRDASVKLGQVNLFIGPNNSGKSNFLKGVDFMAKVVDYYPTRLPLKDDAFAAMTSRTSEVKRGEILSIDFGIHFKQQEFEPLYFFCDSNRDIGQLDFNLEGVVKVRLPNDSTALYPEAGKSMEHLKHVLLKTLVYRPDPAKFQNASAIDNQKQIDADASNLVSFVFHLSQNHKTRFRQLEDDLKNCVGSLVSISTPADPTESGKIKLRFFDKNDVGYWAEEVSEGVLYFLALLCIVHQPDPPKLLLLEEPEKGIHPRRIKEVMDFIFELAQLRGIQIILTSHSPYVVDHFAEMPECISVFDRENDETVIRNAGDLISESNAQLAADGKPPIRYTDSLGEHWVSGFLGGVPA